jgi:hypothetical protein
MPETMGVARQCHPQNELPGRSSSRVDRGLPLASYNLLISLAYFNF